MVYLSKSDYNQLIRKLSKIKDKEIKEIIKNLKSQKKSIKYVREESEIRKLLDKAFNERRKVKIRYYSPHSDEQTIRIIDIYKIYINAITAFCHLRKEERTFVIGRINSAAILAEKYEIPKGWTPENIIIDSP